MTSTGRTGLVQAWNRPPTSTTNRFRRADIDGTGTPADVPTRRFVARQRVRYRADDLSAVLRAR